MYSGIVKNPTAHSYARSIKRTARAQTCTLIGGGAPRCQCSSASRTVVNYGPVADRLDGVCPRAVTSLIKRADSFP
jgi:hypothetical protein